ncbi:hypothetical protein OHA88_14825 [Streptomyces sp. NBC_00353]|uniref:hypothetical protein n=1 Tax=Streptomyces sp. NBC_00353 TaxID=2975722 RepID=UPI002E2554AF
MTIVLAAEVFDAPYNRGDDVRDMGLDDAAVATVGQLMTVEEPIQGAPQCRKVMRTTVMISTSDGTQVQAGHSRPSLIE